MAIRGIKLTGKQPAAIDRLVIPWETSHGMGWDRHKLLWDGNGTDKYVPWTTLAVELTRRYHSADNR